MNHDAAWLAALPSLVADLQQRWSLRADGPLRHGMAGIVLPVLRTDGSPAALKVQPVADDNAATALGLTLWAGNGSVELFEHDPSSGGMLLERLDATRPLASLAGTDTVTDVAAMQILAELLARLVAVQAPAGVRRLADIAAAMVDETPGAARALPDPAERTLLGTCAAVVADLIGEAGDRLLHWDLHYDNVLAGEREPWLAIDPEPLAGDPGFDLWPALNSGWQEIVVPSGDVERTVLRRFDQLTATLGLDRRRAAGWTLGRVLQNGLWDVEDGSAALDPAQVTLARILLEHRML
ncbi:aminoglycoside phosphotransferase family protein [Pseudonocardia sp. TRM90224]|uniref:aminoglycoside phosphotransferase family protein n=1 Tax=Pseudonocardia sp. TRM90224 TaxID=2812678 RepID=UPI0035A8610A